MDDSQSKIQRSGAAMTANGVSTLKAVLASHREAVAAQAEERVKELANAFAAELEAVNHDPDAVTCDQQMYKGTMARSRILGQLTEERPGEPGRREVSPDQVTRLASTARTVTLERYDQFAAELERRVGDHVAVELDGEVVTGTATLTVIDAVGGAVRWRIACVTAVSASGVPYLRWEVRRAQ